ncbi:MAG: ABC transporter ATP-binding protein [Oscillochloridaceae bacterium umkhey_bin13]
MGFILDGLDADAYDRSYGDAVLVRRIASYFRPHARKMLAVGLLVSVATMVEVLIPFVVAYGIDQLAGNPAAQLLLGLAGLVTVLGSLGWFFNFLRQTLAAEAVGDVVLRLREDAFAAVMERDLSFYDQFPSGTIVSRVTSDTQDFANVVSLTMDLISQVLLVGLISLVLVIVQPTLGLLTLATAPLVVLVALLFRRIARWSSQQARRAVANVNRNVQEAVSGIAVAKSFRQEAAIYEGFTATNTLAYRVSLRRGLIFDSIFPVLDMIAGMATAAVVYVGGSLVIGGTITPGQWYLFVQGLAIFYFPMTSIASFWSQFQQGLASSERVFALIDAEPRVVQRASKPTPALQGAIRFERVSFGYADDQMVLRDFDLHIPAGQRIAVVGHTGAGKSSLVKLIARFYEFQAGRILVDELDLRELELGSYRRQIGMVPQVPFLFSGTVAANIRYGRPEASEDEVVVAAAQIGGGEWVADLPQGLATEVGERGARLSLGQRQLVALARVLLHDPRILILDEATASVDPFTEEQIQAGLDLVLRGRTSIVIAHRLSTVRSSDRIIVMRQGQIIEEGDHAGLLRQGGHYAELYATYFRHQSLAYIESVGGFGAE